MGKKYQIELSGQRHETNGAICYDNFSIRRLDKHESKTYKNEGDMDNASEDVKSEAFNEAKEYLIMIPCEYPVHVVHSTLKEIGCPYGL